MARLWRRSACFAAICASLVCTTSAAGQAPRWDAIERAARGQTVYFNAWAGDPAINQYIGWASREVGRLYGVTLVHVKLSDTSVAVNRILAEQAAGRGSGGSVDLIWINGENFASLRQHRLLYGPWTDELPHAHLLDRRNPSVNVDSTLPTRGLELAWGSARFTLFYDARAVRGPPPSDPEALLQWIERHPGRFTYPQPPEFLGTSFLKQLLLLLVADRDRLRYPVGADFDAVTQPLWAWLERARLHLWRAGRVYPRSGPEQRRLLGDGELDWAMSFNPAEGSRAIESGELPATIRATHFRGGILSNSHYLAIPRNARAKEGAMVVANFLLSPEAQARKANEAIWGDPTVLAMDALSPDERRRFADLTAGSATPRVDAPLFAEPHPSWTTAIARAWTERYGAP
ncbi:MAG: ABC transporter substrate-binding protein [Steroidobacteraceae bacterium]